MRKLTRLLGVTIIGVFLFANLGFATQVYYDDLYANWPGQVVADKFTTKDVNGIPDIKGARITTNDIGALLKIEIEFQDFGRLVRSENEFDSLFINTSWGNGENWDNWDYYIKGYDGYATLYSGFGNYGDWSYTYADKDTYRKGHVNGIDVDNLTGQTFAGLDGGNRAFILTYDFSKISGYSNHPLILGSSYVIGYTPFCANDVFLTSVPEPSTMLLLGAGLIALAGVGRKKYFKKA